MDAPISPPHWPLSGNEYKAAKIAFVSDLKGTSIAEISFVTLLTPISFLSFSFLLQLIAAFQRVSRQTKLDDKMLSSSPHFSFLEFALHLVIVEGSLLMSMTYTHLLPQLYAAHFGLMLLCCLTASCSSGVGLSAVCSPLGLGFSSSTAQHLDILNSSRKPFISVYRAQMMLSTVIAILAVDFFVFPRRFAKTEDFGYGLMDVGVGSFIVSHALVSPMTKFAANPASSPSGSGAIRMFVHVLKSVSPMLLMGSARFIMIRSTNYQEHVTEYGVHWNFFFTLAIVALLSTLIQVRSPVSGWLGVALIAGYQYALSNLGLQDYVLHAPRIDFISANKEGICSSIGYFALYLLGVELGSFLNSPPPSSSTSASSIKHWWSKALKLLVLSAALLIATTWSHDNIAPSSRRMVNITYVLWIMFVNVSGIALLSIASLIVPKPSEGCLLAAINANQLFVFLISNLSTGAINLSMFTIYASASISMLVLCGYLTAVCSVAALLYRFKINTKFWA